MKQFPALLSGHITVILTSVQNDLRKSRDKLQELQQMQHLIVIERCKVRIRQLCEDCDMTLTRTGTNESVHLTQLVTNIDNTLETTPIHVVWDRDSKNEYHVYTPDKPGVSLGDFYV